MFYARAILHQIDGSQIRNFAILIVCYRQTAVD